jgi:hypothetical protein
MHILALAFEVLECSNETSRCVSDIDPVRFSDIPGASLLLYSTAEIGDASDGVVPSAQYRRLCRSNVSLGIGQRCSNI